jgi:hypothetical protein
LTVVIVETFHTLPSEERLQFRMVQLALPEGMKPLEDGMERLYKGSLERLCQHPCCFQTTVVRQNIAICLVCISFQREQWRYKTILWLRKATDVSLCDILLLAGLFIPFPSSAFSIHSLTTLCASF